MYSLFHTDDYIKSWLYGNMKSMASRFPSIHRWVELELELELESNIIVVFPVYMSFCK